MKVVVVGGGISGLATAHALVSRGIDATVLEARERIGGVIGSTEQNGFITESAVNGFLDREPAMRDLISALGLEGKLRAASSESKERYVFTRGELRQVPTSPPSLIGSSVLPWSAKFRLLLEPFSSMGPDEDESLASFCTRHLGLRATAILMDAVQTGIFAGDVEKLSVAATFPALARLEREHRSLLVGFIREMKARKKVPPARTDMTGLLSSFEGGMETLPRALEAALGDRIKTRAGAQGLERTAHGWRVRLGDGHIDADKVVLASPAYATESLVRPLSADLAHELEHIEYAPIAILHFEWQRPAKTPRGFGFLVPKEEQRDVLGAMHISNFFSWRAPAGGVLVTALVGGARQPDLVSLPDDALIARIGRELAFILDLAQPPDTVRVVRWQRAIPQYVIGHLDRMKRIDEHLHAFPGLHLTGAGYRGVGVNDCVRNASIVAAAVAGV
jgi:oxygen-dependent protoporphyrinogen oxidase